MLQNTIINVSGLGLEIEGKPILRDVSFAVERGEFLSIIGPNGAGKTSVLKCLNRVVTGWSGTIAVDGRNLNEYRQKELARVVGYVPQMYGVAFPFAVREFLLMNRYPYMTPFRPPTHADHEAVERALQLTGLQGFDDRRLPTLSGGECQKVFIAAALTQQTPVLLLDEPTAFLDPHYQVEINALLARLNRTEKTTIVSVSHDINSAARGSQTILALKQGRVAFRGAVRKLLDPGRLESIFDTPFTFISNPAGDIPVVIPTQP